MESLLSGQGGCCNDIGSGPDFSKLKMPDVDIVWIKFWFMTAAVLFGPFIKPLICAVEYKAGLLTRMLRHNKIAFHLYSCVTVSFSIWTWVGYYKCQQDLSHSVILQNNKVLQCGYICLISGITLKLSTLVSDGWNRIIGDYYFHYQHNSSPAEERERKEITKNDPYYHPNGTSSVLVLFGLSLITAKVPGITVCVLLGLVYWIARHLEKWILHTPEMIFQRYKIR